MARYKGRHRAPTNNGKRLAAFGAALTIPALASTGTAYAGPPGGWGSIISCESGGNPTIQNRSSTASGLFQFINGTWRSYGGTEFAPTAKQATAEQQYIVAERAYAAEGTRPWNASKDCWSTRTSAETPVKAAAPPAALVEPVKAAEQSQVVPAGEFTPGGTGAYEVKPGDTLSFIARDYSTTVEELVDANPDVIEDADWIYAGEKLTIPTANSGPVPQ